MPAPHQGRALRSWLLATALALATPVLAHAEPLTLAEALSRAAKADPSRPALTARLDAAEAAVRQATVRPNPVVGVEVEDMAGSGPYSLVDRTQATVYYQQSQERGGKRAARGALARGDISLTRLRDDIRVLDLLHEVELAWIEALAAEAEARLAADRLTIAQRAQAEVNRRVKVARDPLFAGARADAQVAEAGIALSQAQARATNARRALAAFLGGGEIEIDATALEDLSPADQAAGPASATDLALIDAQRGVAAARLRVEESKAVQDPTWRAGLRYLNDGGDDLARQPPNQTLAQGRALRGIAPTSKLVLMTSVSRNTSPDEVGIDDQRRFAHQEEPSPSFAIGPDPGGRVLEFGLARGRVCHRRDEGVGATDRREGVRPVHRHEQRAAPLAIAELGHGHRLGAGRHHPGQSAVGQADRLGVVGVNLDIGGQGYDRNRALAAFGIVQI